MYKQAASWNVYAWATGGRENGGTYQICKAGSNFDDRLSTALKPISECSNWRCDQRLHCSNPLH